MMRRPFFASVTRISDLHREPFVTRPLPRDRWADGDYVVGKVTGSPSPLYRVELTTGRMVDLMEGDELVGVLGQRNATLEAVGHWQSVTPDLLLHTLTGAGLFGRATSVAPTGTK